MICRFKLVFFFALFFAFGLQSQATEVSCGSMLSGVSPGAEILKANEIHWSKAQAVLTGALKPGWEAYSWADAILSAAQEGQISARDLQTLKPKIEKASQEFQVRAKQNEKETKVFVDHSYRYFQILEQINKTLRSDIFPNIYLKWAPEDPVLIEQGRATVRHNEKRLRSLYKTSGYKNVLDLVHVLENYHQNLELSRGKQHADRVKNRAASLLSLVNNGLQVTIRRPVAARFWVPLAGFQNQRVTGSSKGSFNPDFRNEVEAGLTGQAKSDYEKYSVRYQPQYGEARPHLGYQDLTFATNAHQYGPDLWIIKESVIEERATFTPVDSFSQPRKTNGEADVWSQMFLPWSHRELLVPYLLNQAVNADRFEASTPKVFPLKNGGSGGGYVEVQVWGPVTLDDVQAFAFTQNPAPDVAFVKRLRSKGIEVLDARYPKVVPYEVPE